MLQHLAVREIPIGIRLCGHGEPEHPRLVRGRTVEVEIVGMKVDRTGIAAHEIAHGGHVVEMSVREQDRLRLRAPVRKRGFDSSGIGAGIDHQRGAALLAGPHEMTVRLKGADRQGEDLQPAGFGRGAQTEKEVPQPQEPVAFGFSNVKPEPLKLLW